MVISQDPLGILILMMNLEHRDSAIPFDFDEYLKLIDWSGRAILDNKRAAIPEHALS